MKTDVKITGSPYPALIERALQGDQLAYTKLFNMTKNYVGAAVSCMISQKDAAQDIIQDTYIKAFSSLDKLENPEIFRTWIWRIAVNKAKDYLRKNRPALFSELAAEDDVKGQKFEDSLVDECQTYYPDVALEKKEAAAILSQILGELDEAQRVALCLHCRDGVSIREIAMQFGCSENTVKSRIHYAKKKVIAKVQAMEKQGTRLYTLKPAAYVQWLFHTVPAVELPQDLLGDIFTQCGICEKAEEKTENKPAAASGLWWKLGLGILIGILVGGLLVGFFAYRMGRDSAPSPVAPSVAETEETTEPTESPAQNSAELAYQQIIKDYLAAIQAEDYMKAPESYLPFRSAALDDHHSNGYPDRKFYYSLWDVNGDGLTELLIGYGDGSNPQLIDFWGFDGRQPRHIVEDPLLGMGSHLFLYEDGTVYWQDFMKDVSSLNLLSGAELVLVENSEESSEKAVHDQVESKKLVSGLQWHTLDGTTMPGTGMVYGEPTEPFSKEEEAFSAAMQEILDHYGMLMALDHEPFYFGRYNDFDYSQDVFHYHALALGPDVLDDTFYDTSESHTCSLCYETVNLDGDSYQELLIGESIDGQKPRLLRVFYFDGEKMQPAWEESGRLMEDGTVIEMRGNGGEIVSVKYFRHSFPEIVTDSEIPLGFPQDYETLEKLLYEIHGGDVTMSGDQKIPMGTPPAAEEIKYSSAYTLQQIRDVYTGLEAAGRISYERDPDSFREIYDPYLGFGVSDRLFYDAFDGLHAFCLFALDFDADGDGKEDLLIGYGVSPSRITLLAMYQEVGNNILPVSAEKVMSWGPEIPCVNVSTDQNPWDYLGDWK